MASQFAVFVDGVEADFLSGLDDDSRRAAAFKAINKVARDARAAAAREIRDQVNLPARYVSPGEKRLHVSKQASKSRLEAVITAQGRATSLARFVTGTAKPGRAGLHVEVHPGKARFMRRAFLIRLPQGSSPVTDTRANLALAIRLRPGETLQRKHDARRVEKGLYVLYGPSVNQIFRSRDGSGVANDLAPEIVDDLQAEFLRLLDL